MTSWLEKNYISDLKGEEIVGTFYEMNCKKHIRKNLGLKK